MTPFGNQYLDFVRSIRPESRLRLAPTPSGYLHLGNALNFVLNWLAVRTYPGARLLLRIDDLDADRKRPEFVSDIFDTLHWLGLDWDEGPQSAADFEAHWSQQSRVALYLEVLARLRALGHLFACAKSRGDLAPYAGHYPVEFQEQGLPLDAHDVAWRIKTPRSSGLEMPPDFVVRRRDGIPAYQVASLADDRHFGVSHVIRGEDLAPSTAAQQYLASCLGWPDFTLIRFLHHPLVQDATGEKLSKSAGAAALQRWRMEDIPPVTVFQEVSTWLGLSKTARSAVELLAFFSNDSIKPA